MGKLGRITLALLLMSTSACRGDKDQSVRSTTRSPQGQTAAKPRSREPSPFDDQGNLLASEEKVYWLSLPRGFERSALSRPRHLVFESAHVPVGKLRDYLAQHMLTGEVDELGEGARYHAVMPIQGGGEDERFDVSATTPRAGLTLLRVDLLSYPGVKPLSVQQAKAALARERAEAE